MSHLNSKNHSPSREIKVTEGVNILLSLFSAAKQQRIFPRNIMTPLTNGQATVHSVKEIKERFVTADYQDCRINAYPAFINEAEERDYEKGINLDLFTPNILFLDIDLNNFPSKIELDKTINKIKNHISKILPGSQPIILWSGRGYHFVIPVNVAEALEHFEEFKSISNKPSEELLRFAKSYLSFDKADNANNSAFRSCQLRVPYSLNSKCINEGIDPEVKVIQKFDTSKPLPNINNLMVEFMTDLSDRKLKERVEKDRQVKSRNKYLNHRTGGQNTIPYVEKLLKIPIIDYRKSAISLILAPYFVNILYLPDEESFHRINQWVLKCGEVKSLEPSIRDFDTIIKNAVKRAKTTGIKPLKFKDTLQYKNKELFRLLSSLLS
ncbi:MAG: DNA primase noncatalytic subunit PriX [Candidatus Nitrosocosmicus sp.]|nr:DNA primase noncatalytic subunit PriX [Candidatus Nitrosocosmicus sp.]MDN5867955.1 DNA primase noncatalytic subunit PriX [Candidatus Nitrosocosmicus sp.]